MENAEYAERLARVEEQTLDNTRQIADIKPIVKEIESISKTLIELVTELKHTNRTVNELKTDVDDLKSIPGKTWNDTKKTFFTAMTSCIGTAFAIGIMYMIVQFL